MPQLRSVTKTLSLVLLSLFVLVILWISADILLPKLQPENTAQQSGELLADESLADEPLADEPIEEFVLFTMPKTGTHLLRPLLEYLTGKNSISYWSAAVDCPKSYLYDKNLTDLLLLLPNVVQAYWLHQPIPTETFTSVLDHLQDRDDFLVTHAPFSPEMEEVLQERNCLVFFLIRDPRDWVISVIKHPPISGLDIYGQPIGDRYFLSLDMNQKINYILDGTSKYYSTLAVLNRFLDWKDSEICCPLRFEALLGARGGYSEQAQLAELRKISEALSLDVSDEDLLEAFKASFGTGIVFSKGKAGTWKEHFTEEHKKRFKELLGDVLIELGYEQDYNW